jgi:hypothetical protein
MDIEAISLAIKDILGVDGSKHTDNERVNAFITALMNCPVNMTLDLRDIFMEATALKASEPVQVLKVKRGRPGLKRACVSFSGSMYYDDWAKIDKIIEKINRDRRQCVTRNSIYRAVIEVGVRHKDELEIDL